MSSNNNNQNAPAVSWRFKGTQGATPWKESYVESSVAAELASALVPSAGAAAAAPALSAAVQEAQLTQASIAQATTTAADTVQWNLEALHSRGQNGVLGELVATEVASQTLASVESMRPYAYGLGMGAAQDPALAEHTKPLEWPATEARMESTRPYTTDSEALAIFGSTKPMLLSDVTDGAGTTKPLEWSAAETRMESTRPYTTDSEALAIFGSTKPMLLTDVTDGAGTTKPLEWSPSMSGALEQPLALALEGSAQQLLQAMAGFAPSAMGTAATASGTQAVLWNQAIAVGAQS
ncbi:hypothetical protein [Acidovorax sp. NCPPB 3576]|uniref:hypothetical protein n=1 Tax=Acidovorax sp. NCPPB 3576 TaxID=2940488 RepID=UPI0023499CDA|nr:hypothetical protein [Acidovorax sp. NCPPB 3576]WCM90217.1 hypothetical protein M5C98_09475 [Acidovorax sp. NCPPB 3576]